MTLPIELLMKEFPYSGDVDMVKETRIGVTTRLHELGIESHFQMIYALRLRGNRFEIYEGDVLAYLLTYRYESGLLACFDIVRKLRTYICWYLNCDEGYTSGNCYLLCGTHSKLYSSQILPQYKIEKEAVTIDARDHLTFFANWDLARLQPNQDAAHEGLLKGALSIFSKFVNNISAPLFNPQHSGGPRGISKETKKHLKLFLMTSGPVRVGNLRLSLDASEQAFSYSICDKSGVWSEEKFICKNDECFCPVTSGLGKCVCCIDTLEWNAFVIERLLSIVGKSEWRQLNDNDERFLRMAIQSCPHRALRLGPYTYVSYSHKREIFLVRHCNQEYSICTNFEAGCCRIQLTKYNAVGICTGCDNNYVFGATLLHLRPSDSYVSVVCRRRVGGSYNYRHYISHISGVPSSLRHNDFLVVRQTEFYNNREAAVSVAAAYLLFIIYIKDFYENSFTRIANSQTFIGKHMWRFVKLLALERGLHFEDNHRELQFPDFLPHLIDLTWKFETRDRMEARPWYYKADAYDMVYFGVNQHFVRERTSIIAPCHDSSRKIASFEAVRQFMKDIGMIHTHESVTGVEVGICANMSLICALGGESIILSSETYDNEMHEPERRITNVLISSTRIPRYSLPELQRIMLDQHNRTFWITGTWHERTNNQTTTATNDI